MRFILFFLFSLALLSLSGCIEIIDDISLNDDGSGSFKYTVNLSSSKVKVNSYLALDSLNGKKVPSKPEIRAHIDRVIQSLTTKEGISNVEFTADETQYIFKLKLDFSSVEHLQTAIQEIVKEESHSDSDQLSENWIQFDQHTLTRSIPDGIVDKIKTSKKEDTELLKEGTYTSITRFSKTVKEFSNDQSVLAKNQLAIMLRKDAYSILNNPNLLDNTILLNEE